MKYCFGPFVIDPQERRLLRNSVEIHLQPKTFDTLLFLIERRGHLLSKDDLMAQLWPNQVVTEHSITRCIREVRKALGDNPGDSQFIETIPKAGYRFIAGVQKTNQARSESGFSSDKNTRRTAWISAGLLVAAFVTGLLALQWIKSSELTTTKIIPVLAILPFENETSSAENDLVLVGLVQDIRERLSSSGRVAVTSGTSAAALGSSVPNQAHWPQALNADWLLRGSLQQDHKRQSVRIQLASATGEPGWAQEIEITSGDLIGLSNKISSQVASVLGFSLPDQARYLATAASVESINAHHQYLMARGLIAQRNSSSLTSAIQLLHQVLEAMPDHSNALAALGIAYVLSPDTYYPVGVAIDRAEGLFETALEKDPNSALAWAGKALVQIQLDADLELLRQYIEKALQLNPYDADVLAWAANLAGSEGRIDDAFDYFQRALVVDPLHTTVNGNLSFNLAAQGRYDQATELLDNLSTRLGNHPALYYFKVSIAEASGDLRKALELAQDAMVGWPEGLFFSGQLANTYARLQMINEANAWIEYMLSLDENIEQSAGAQIGVASSFNDQSAIELVINRLLADSNYRDESPQLTPPWLLTHLVQAYGLLEDCNRLQEYFAYQFEVPESLQGRRGNFSSVADLAHWNAWCALQSNDPDTAHIWLDQVSNQFEFMKQRGLGDSPPYMYVEAQNLHLQGEQEAALSVLESLIEIGWLDQGSLQHDPRWAGLKQTPRFKQLLRKVTDSTTAIRNEIDEDGIVGEFEQEFRESLQSRNPD